MKVSIRASVTDHGLIRLTAFRPRERTWPLSGSAYQTKSGFWIVQFPGHPADVVATKADAVRALEGHYLTKGLDAGVAL